MNLRTLFFGVLIVFGAEPARAELSVVRCFISNAGGEVVKAPRPVFSGSERRSYIRVTEDGGVVSLNYNFFAKTLTVKQFHYPYYPWTIGAVELGEEKVIGAVDGQVSGSADLSELSVGYSIRCQQELFTR